MFTAQVQYFAMFTALQLLFLNTSRVQCGICLFIHKFIKKKLSTRTRFIMKNINLLLLNEHRQKKHIVKKWHS